MKVMDYIKINLDSHLKIESINEMCNNNYEWFEGSEAHQQSGDM